MNRPGSGLAVSELSSITLGAVTGNRPESNGDARDLEAIADVARTFFGAFVSGPDCAAGLERLREVLLPEAVIIRTGGDQPAIYGVDAFIAPRQAQLSGGTLVEFSEWELSGRTDLFGDIAHRFCSYAKTGVQDGAPIHRLEG